MKKIVISLILVIILVCSSVIGYLNFNKIKIMFTHSKSYSYSDLQDEYNHGYDDGNKSHKEDSDKIAYLQKQLDEYQENIKMLSRDLLTSTNINKELKNKVSDLEKQISDFKKQIQELNGNKGDLEKQIIDLQKQIKELQGIVDAYEQGGVAVENKIHLVFVYDARIIKNVLIDKDSKISDIEIPIDTEKMKFVSWQIDDVDIDLASYVFTQNTVVKAKINYFYKCDIFINNQIISSEYLIKDSVLENYLAEKKDVVDSNLPKDYVFDYYSIDNVRLSNVYKLYKDTAIDVNLKYCYETVLENFAFSSKHIKVDSLKPTDLFKLYVSSFSFSIVCTLKNKENNSTVDFFLKYRLFYDKSGKDDIYLVSTSFIKPPDPPFYPCVPLICDNGFRKDYEFDLLNQPDSSPETWQGSGVNIKFSLMVECTQSGRLDVFPQFDFPSLDELNNQQGTDSEFVDIDLNDFDISCSKFEIKRY